MAKDPMVIQPLAQLPVHQTALRPVPAGDIVAIIGAPAQIFAIVSRVKLNRILVGVGWALLLAVGYAAGAFVKPHLVGWLESKWTSKVDAARIFSLPLVDLQTGVPVRQDTLLAHERNLLVFGEPSCPYCRQFFQHKLNAEAAGIFCIPQEHDFKYLGFFVDNYDIDYPQLVIRDETGFSTVGGFGVSRVPMFVVLDSNGNVISQYVGLSDLESALNTLYGHS